MRVIEYKLEIKEDGSKYHPAWVMHDGNQFGLFPNEKTYIGVIPEEDDTDYFIPNDRFIVITLEELIERSIKEQNKEGSVNRLTDIEGNVLNEEGVRDCVSTWWNSII